MSLKTFAAAITAATVYGKHPDLVIRQEDPLNAGPPPDRLLGGDLTPVDLFYVRNHGAVPEVDRAGYWLTVDGLVRRPFRISLEELQRLPRVTVAATLQCAGNRRSEMMAVKEIPNELGWGAEAIGTADWGGVPLSAVLSAADPEPAARYVELTGLDETERHGHRFQFGGSIPLDKALQPEVLLAYEMNGKPLPPVHGAPLRLVVPGYIGARSVKWLSRLTVQAEPSANYFQARAYRLFPPDMGPENVDWESGLMLGTFNVSSLICAPGADAALAAGPVTVRGWAFAGEREVARVDLSVDGGRTWRVAELAPGRSRWSWRLWQATVDLEPGGHELVCRAFDTAAQTQPESPAHVWNFKGYMNNAWHRVRVVCS
jgi:sulfite oxidase